VARHQPDGTLTYTFVESVKATYPFYVIRLAGGLLYLGGMLIMALERVGNRDLWPFGQGQPFPP
jgi:cbb3-type cytochrome oxidase subunit 1